MATWKRRAVDTLRKMAAPLGVNVISSWRLARLQQAEYLARLFSHFGISIVVDVGANEGQYRDFLRNEVGYSGRILSVEPLPDLADAMRKRAAADSSWIIENVALGAAPGIAEFKRMRETEFSSFLTPRHDHVAIFDRQNAVVETIMVTVDTLDNMFSRHEAHGERVYLKMDTQGYDLEVLRGASVGLRSVLALQSEVSVRPIYDGMPRYDEAIGAIEREGFAMSGIFPNNEGHFPLLVEMDCHFVRAEVAPRKSTLSIV